MSAAACTALEEVFDKAVSVVHEHIGPKAFKPVSSFNAAVFDAILIATARRLDKGPIKDFTGFTLAYKEVLNNSDFQQWTSRSTADDETVKKRLQLATDAFSQVS